MKQFITIALISILFITQSFAQKGFEGVVKYKIEYEDLPEEMASMEAMLPKEMTIKIKGNKSRTEQNSGMGSTISIANGDDGSMVTLMSMMGNKTAIKMGENDLKKQREKSPKPEITYLSETKKIAGYMCKKAEIKMGDVEDVLTVFYTTEIQNSKVNEQYEGLKGFPMQYGIKNQGIAMTMTVVEVEEMKISKSEFTIPEDYKVMSMEKFQNSMGIQIGEQ